MDSKTILFSSRPGVHFLPFGRKGPQGRTLGQVYWMNLCTAFKRIFVSSERQEHRAMKKIVADAVRRYHAEGCSPETLPDVHSKAVDWLVLAGWRVRFESFAPLSRSGDGHPQIRTFIVESN
jgi:hypothetical protein